LRFKYEDIFEPKKFDKIRYNTTKIGGKIPGSSIGKEVEKTLVEWGRWNYENDKSSP
jgi:hypothetical protein